MATALPMLLHFSGLSKGSRKGLLQQATLVRKPAGSLTFNTFCRFWAAGLPSAHADREGFFPSLSTADRKRTGGTQGWNAVPYKNILTRSHRRKQIKQTSQFFIT